MHILLKIALIEFMNSILIVFSSLTMQRILTSQVKHLFLFSFTLSLILCELCLQYRKLNDLVHILRAFFLMLHVCFWIMQV